MDTPNPLQNTTTRRGTESHWSTSTEMTSSPPQPQHQHLVAHNAAHALRLACRSGSFTGPTSGLAPGHIQASLLILPLSASPSFFALCQRNPVPCPLLAYSKPGSATEFISCLQGISGKEIVGDFDVRTDAPGYFLYENGKRIWKGGDVKAYFKENDGWREIEELHIAFLIGSSFSFETALANAGLPPRHWMTENPGNAPMYQTKVPLLAAGIFKNPGCMVVSMRPYQLGEVEKVRHITSAFGSMHEPIAWGWDAVEKLGIRDIFDVDFGGPTDVRFEEGEVPVFWGCGVTPQVAVMGAGSAIKGVVIAHNPGHMVLLDLTEKRALAAEKRIFLGDE